jgi:hypothetical protein
MSKEERRAHWRTLIEKQTESGLSGAAFCRQHHIKVSQFYRWHRRFREDRLQDGASNGFMELVPLSGQTASGIRIHLRDGVSIEVDRGFDPLTLRNAIEALGA